MAALEADNAENCSDSEADFNELRDWLNNTELVPTEQMISCLASTFLSLLKRTMNKVNQLTKQLERGEGSIEDRSFEAPAVTNTLSCYERYFNPYFRDAENFMPEANKDSISIRERNLPDMLAPRNKKWTAQEAVLLRDSVKSVLKKELMNELSDECISLKEALSEARQKPGEESAVEELLNLLKLAGNNLNELESDGPLLDTALSNADSFRLIDWDLVASHPPSQLEFQLIEGSTIPRSADDCLYAWMGAFAPWIKQGSWCAEELQRLDLLSKRHNDHHWDLVARELGTGRTAYHCAEKVLSQREAICEEKLKWTSERDALLVENVECVPDVGPSWKKVTVEMGELQARSCIRRYESLKVRHGKWTAEEDDRLLKAVAEYGNSSWSQVAAAVGTRTDTQCRNRYVYFLSAKSKGGPWSQLEDELLMVGVDVFGTQWMKVRFLLPHRGAQKAQNRYRFLRGSRYQGFGNNNGMSRKRKQPVSSIKLSDIPTVSSLPAHLLSILTEEQKTKLESELTMLRRKYDRNVQ